MTGILVIISLLFGVAGYAYGKGAGTITGSVQAINAVVKTYSGLAGLIFLLLIIAQFIAFFNYTNIATVLAVVLADALEAAGLGPIPLIIGFVLVTALLDIIIPGVIPKWAIFAPIFIPLFLRLGIAPQLVLAAYRVGDSPFNVITPLMAYFAVIVVFAQRYDKTAGVGTIVSLMIPYSIDPPARVDRLPRRLVRPRHPARTNQTTRSNEEDHRVRIISERRSCRPGRSSRTADKATMAAPKYAISGVVHVERRIPTRLAASTECDPQPQEERMKISTEGPPTWE